VTDVAGVVVSVGPGVNGFQDGDRVVAMLNSFVSALLRAMFSHFNFQGTNLKQKVYCI
jgi:NADPH:quinone reductase-like Zn-dependent oxidoreductase